MLITSYNQQDAFSNTPFYKPGTPVVLPQLADLRTQPNATAPPKAPPPSLRKRQNPDKAQTLARKRLQLELSISNSIKKVKNPTDKVDEKKDGLIQGKQLLSDILKEYEQMAKDKTLLAVEIRNMKHYLSEIRSKLDQSLTVLNKTTDLFALHTQLNKRLLAAQKTSFQKYANARHRKRIIKQKMTGPNPLPEHKLKA